MTPAYILDAVRTPVGKLGGALASARPDDLAAATLKELTNRTNVDPAELDDVFLGNANGAGEENRDVARMAALLAGFPTSVPGTTVNRLCGSGLEAAIQAARAIETNDADLVIAGGVESMSRAPWVLPKPDRAYPHGSLTAESTSLGWRLVNPKMPTEWTISLGEATERLADKYGVTRDAQDLFALESHEKAAKAWAAGTFDAELVPWERLERRGSTAHQRRVDPRRRHAGNHGQAQARIPCQRHCHGGERLDLERWCVGGPAGQRGGG